MKRLTILAALALPALLLTAAPKSAAEIEKAIDGLLQKMTLEEKIGQLNQVTGVGYNSDMAGRIKSGEVGSILNEVDPATVNRLQKEAVENTRLGIPLIFARDVIHGFKTIFPIPLGQAASWNPELARKGARIAADEASSVGVRWTFSPMVDIARDARWGRCAEGFGEDPYLDAVMGVAMTEGYQGDDLSQPNTMAACVKHFAGYGAAESGVDYNTTWIPDPLLRNIYLPPFKKVVDAGAATIMVSFNDINGVPSSGNKWMLRNLLRDEWGFDGVVVSDWGSIMQMVPQHVASDLKDAGRIAANAGVDIDMESHAYAPYIKQLVEEGKVSQAVVDELVRNVLRLKYRLALFDNPYVDMANASRFYLPESIKAAQQAAEESAVLLKNDGVLPLAKKPGKIAVIGPMADAQHDQAGTWVFDLEKEHSVTPLTALRKKYGEKNVIYAPGLEFSRQKDTALFKDALEAAAKADVILYFAGEEAVLSGEAHCLADISLQGAQTELLRELKALGKPIVTVIQAGRALTIPEETELSDALLYCFHAGTMAGPAITSLIAGDVNPSGHLPVTMAKMTGQLPLYYNRNNIGRPAENIVLIDDIPLEAGQTSTGCTSFYLDAGDKPLFPFGYGLSYTDFEISEPTLSSTELSADGNITVTCTVKNTGKRAGADVVQMYLSDEVASLVRPVCELKGFEKVMLQPGESRDVTFTITPDDIAFYDLQSKLQYEPGWFTVRVGDSSVNGKTARFEYK